VHRRTSLKLFANVYVEVLRLSSSDSLGDDRLRVVLIAWPCECVRNVDGMKLSRHQVIGSVVLALIVLAVMVVRAWPLLFPK
jgi:hypothetical protein